MFGNLGILGGARQCQNANIPSARRMTSLRRRRQGRPGGHHIVDQQDRAPDQQGQAPGVGTDRIAQHRMARLDAQPLEAVGAFWPDQKVRTDR